MPDRAQVIYDIERCVCHVPDACRDCSKYGSNNAIRCMEDLLSDALALLREQEPVEPKRVLGVLPDWYHCGGCGFDMLDTGDGYRPKYCPLCGRAVKWNGC